MLNFDKKIHSYDQMEKCNSKMLVKKNHGLDYSFFKGIKKKRLFYKLENQLAANALELIVSNYDIDKEFKV